VGVVGDGCDLVVVVVVILVEYDGVDVGGFGVFGY